MSTIGSVAPKLAQIAQKLAELSVGPFSEFFRQMAEDFSSITDQTFGPNILSVDNSTTTSGAGSPVNLKSFSLPANTLDVDGKAIRILAWGTSANNANAKTVRLSFGATQLVSQTLVINGVRTWFIDAYVFRTGAATQDWYCDANSSDNANPNVAKQGTAGETLSGAVTIQVSCTQGAAADVIEEGLLVEVLTI